MRVYEVRRARRDGAFAVVDQLNCSNDDECIEKLARHRHRGPLELWDGDRLVWRLDAAFSGKRRD